jgi:hypothetical protein
MPTSHCVSNLRSPTCHKSENVAEAETDVLPDMALLDAKIAETEAAMKAAEATTEKRRLKVKREDLMRLRRVEQIYVWYFSVLCTCICMMQSTEHCSPSTLQLGTCPIEASVGHRFGILSGSTTNIRQFSKFPAWSIFTSVSSSHYFQF